MKCICPAKVFIKRAFLAYEISFKASFVKDVWKILF
jgi:hypothetical protein